MKKTLTTEQFQRLFETANVSVSQKNMDKLKDAFEGRSRIDPRVHMIRALVARGEDPKMIARKLNIQTYQAKTALDKRATLSNDRKYTVQELRQDPIYKNKFWTSEQFNEIVERPAVKVFNYKNLEVYRNVLVKDE